jgi:LacI family transcriptional regulator
MPVLMKDVAARAGVSITTVSHVLNGTRPIAAATRALVMNAIEETNYYTNAVARLLVKGQSDTFGLIISDIENPFFPELVKAFERSCSSAGLELLLGMTNYEQPKAEAAVRRMIENRVRGVAVMTSQLDERLVERLLKVEIPVVSLDSPKIGRNRCRASIDYAKGIAEAVDHLHELGHINVAIAHGPLRRVSALRYRDVLVSSIAERRMRLLEVIEGEGGPEGGALATRKLLSAKTRPTAIFYGNDEMAIGGMGEASKLGVSVPEELSIVGSDDIPFARYCHPPLSTVRIPRDELGQEIFRLLEKLIATKRRRGSEIAVATSFVSRGSSGRAPAVR